MGSPKIKDLIEWQDLKKEIIIREYNALTQKTHLITGIITNIQLLGTSDALIKINTHKYEIYLKHIISYGFKSCIFLEQTDNPLISKVILKSDNCTLLVNREGLANKCDYFKRLFDWHITKSSSGEIDLSASFDEKTLLVLLTFLDDRSHELNTLDQGLKLLVAGDLVGSEEMIQQALILIDKKITKEKFNQLVINRNELHPLISNWILNLSTWAKNYPKTVSVLDLILDNKHLHKNASEYQKEIENLKDTLKQATNKEWSFNGNIFKSESIVKERYSNKVIQVLIARGILSGYKEQLTQYWECSILKPDNLLMLHYKQLCLDIDEASKLLSHIAGHPCEILHLYGVADGTQFRILEFMGCIGAKEYCTSFVVISDFNLEKLRLLKEKGLSMKELKKRYKEADPAQPLFEQIIKGTDPAQRASSIASAQSFFLAFGTNEERNVQVNPVNNNHYG